MKTAMRFSTFNYKISGGNENARYSFSESLEEGIIYLNITASYSEKTVPSEFSLSFTFPQTNCTAVWNPHIRCHKIPPEWCPVENNSRLASGLPLQALISPSGQNRLAVALSDVDSPTKISMGYIEETADILCKIDFFTRPTNARNDYSVTVRLDTRDIPYYDALYSAADYFENTLGFTPAYVPENARLPMDSLWYSFHQELSPEKILNECREAKRLGINTVIIDDGWQTDDNNRGYAYCGDWEPSQSKMGDIKELINEIHKLDMKLILWFSVPFMGKFARRFEEFKNCLLDNAGNGENSYGLDPRYKKVRDYLASTYENAVSSWKLDGLKLDFIDSFHLSGKSLEYDENRDFQSLEDSLHALFTEIKERLTKINPEILIEFRQSYIGPSIRRYGNMLRGSDCPGDITSNRCQTVNLRYTSGKTPVHSDMIMWHYGDSVENAALQFANIIFAVPQISMRLDELTSEHRKMLKYYIDFWTEHRDVLMNGKLTAKNPESDYTSATATLGDSSVIALYSDRLAEIKTNCAVVVNAGALESVVIKAKAGSNYKTVDCMGEAVETGTLNTLTELHIPTAGMTFIW